MSTTEVLIAPSKIAKTQAYKPSKPGADLANLDILRAAAVLIVVLAHSLMYAGRTPHFCKWMGLTGVCMFFVHTCLVLMWSLERDPHPGRFYIRRAFRLYPLWLVVLGFVVATRFPIAPPAAPGWAYLWPSKLEILANATMTFNLWFGMRVVGASGTLPLELQMYILLPVLFFFIRSTRALWVLLVIDALVLASVWSVVHGNPQMTLAISIPYFIPGIMAYALTKKTGPRLPGWTFLLFLAVLVPVDIRFGNLFLSSFFCLGLGLGIPFFRQISWRPLTRVAHLIARYSYGIYLCHIPSICVALHFIPRGHSIFLRLAVFVAVLTASSVGLYHAVEEPMIRLGSKLAKRVESGPEPRVDERTLSLEPAP